MRLSYAVDPEAPVLYEATVRTPIAPMHSEPNIACQMISQQVGGQVVDVLETESDWSRARGADGYDGWVHVGFLERSSVELETKHQEVEGRRRYVDNTQIPRVHGGTGTAIISTSHGVMTGHQARSAGVGGEVVAYVW